MFGGSTNTASLGAIASVAGQSLVQGVRIRTAITPEISIAPFAASPGQPAPGSFSLASFLKPSMDIDTPGGTFHYAPNGEPENFMPHTIGLLAAVVAGGSFLLGCNKTLTKWAAITAAVALLGGEALRRFAPPALGQAVSP